MGKKTLASGKWFGRKVLRIMTGYSGGGEKFSPLFCDPVAIRGPVI
jgi:hypothetical protein